MRRWLSISLGSILGTVGSITVALPTAVQAAPPTAGATSVLATVAVPDAHAVAVNPVTNRVYVDNASSISVIDGASHAVTEVGTPGGPAADIAVDPLSNRYYVVNFQEAFHDPPRNFVWGYDGATNELISSVRAGDEGFGLALNPITKRAYVVSDDTHEIQVIDTAANAVVGSFPGAAEQYSQSAMTIDPTTHRLHIVNAGFLTILDGTTFQTVAHLAVGGQRTPGVAVDSTRSRIYVTDESGGRVVVVDGASLSVVDQIAVGGRPSGIGVDPVRNRIYTGNNADDTVAVIDGDANEVIETVAVGEGEDDFWSGVGHDVAVNPSTHRVYVTNQGEHTVSVLGIAPVDTATALVSSRNPSVAGDTLTFTVTVSSDANGPRPTGTVTFRNGTTPLGTAPLNEAGTASVTTSSLPVGSHAITAEYNGDELYLGSTSSVLTQRVNLVPTTLRAEPAVLKVSGLSLRLSVINSSARLTRSDTGAPIANQPIAFRAGNQPLCTAVTDANGFAKCPPVPVSGVLGVLLAGGYDAAFAGSAAHAASSAHGRLIG